MPQKKKIIIGLTGSFGSGKTTVAKMFSHFGAKIIDADTLAHRCLAVGKPAYRKIIRIFGQEILTGDKNIDRGRLGKIVFTSDKLLMKLTCIIHPEVIREIKKEIQKSAKKIIVIDAPLLIEAGLKDLVDRLVVVKINRNNQIRRIQKKMSLRRADILRRIRYQIPLKDKVRIADFVIDNNASLQETRRQVEAIWRKYFSLAA